MRIKVSYEIDGDHLFPERIMKEIYDKKISVIKSGVNKEITQIHKSRKKTAIGSYKKSTAEETGKNK